MGFLTFLTLSIVVTTCLAADDKKPFFRKDYVYNEAMSAFYKGHRTRQNWTAAVAYCAGEGAELLLPQSKAEAEGAAALLPEGSNEYYVGLHDIFSEGEFVTLNGTSSELVYTNWAPGEPNNEHNGEDCVVVNRNGFYNDGECHKKELFFCKRSAIGLKLNEICETYDKDYFYSLEMDRCYKFHSVPMSWFNAFRKCKTEESQLAIINSVQEAKIFVNLFAKYPPETFNENFDKSVIHLGFNELISPGLFTTVEGKLISETGYERWSPGQPDSRDNVEHCGSMFRDGTLNDVECSRRAMFVCEKTLSNTDHMDLRINGDQIRV